MGFSQFCPCRHVDGRCVSPTLRRPLVFVYSVFDRKLKEYGQPILAKNHEAIRRTVVDGIRGSGGMVEKHAADFDVMCVGTFDVDSGDLQGQAPQLIANVAEILEVPNGVR